MSMGNVLSHKMQQLLKQLLLTILKEERRIESQRQKIATLEEFDPYLAFQSICNQRSQQISSVEIHKFLRDQSVDEATEADCLMIVQYFDSNQDGYLDAQDFIQMMLPCDNMKMRKLIENKPLYLVLREQRMTQQSQIELTKLLECEIQYNRRTEKIKQQIESSKEFDFEKAFNSIDDWKYGYIDRRNLNLFLRKHGFMSTVSDVLTIIRRMDLDADARLTKLEFYEGIRPCEPYSKIIKRKESSQKTLHKRQKTPTFYVSKSGLIPPRDIHFSDKQVDIIRTQALDRSNSRERSSKSPLKKRPMIRDEMEERVPSPFRKQNSSLVQCSRFQNNNNRVVSRPKSSYTKHKATKSSVNVSIVTTTKRDQEIQVTPPKQMVERDLQTELEKITLQDDPEKLQKSQDKHTQIENPEYDNRDLIVKQVNAQHSNRKSSPLRIKNLKKSFDEISSSINRDSSRSYSYRYQEEGYNSVRRAEINQSYIEQRQKEENEVKGIFLKALLDLVNMDHQVEQIKINLSLKHDFNLIDSFGLLDKNGKGFVTPLELRDQLEAITNKKYTLDEIDLFFERYNKQHDAKFRYTDFTSAVMPLDEHYARLQGMKRMYYLNYTIFNKDTLEMYNHIWNLLIVHELEAEKIRHSIYQRFRFQMRQVFQLLDIERDGYLTYVEMRQIFREQGQNLSTTDHDYLLSRFDLNKDGKISFEEFDYEFQPRMRSLEVLQ